MPEEDSSFDEYSELETGIVPVKKSRPVAGVVKSSQNQEPTRKVVIPDDVKLSGERTQDLIIPNQNLAAKRMRNELKKRLPHEPEGHLGKKVDKDI